MTIKEIEALTGMERANIRFYEREGLIITKRMENGYRNYSEDNRQDLLKIKLLRSLHIPLDEIKALKHGTKNLSDTLINQINKLEQEKCDASYAQEICCAIQEEKISFSNLDPEKYLNGINISYSAIKEDKLPQVSHPWRRFFARSFDMFLYNILLSAFIAFVFHVNLINRTALGNLLDSIIIVILMLIIEPILLHVFGTTPGKAILGLRIEDTDGRHLSFSQGLERTWNLIAKGYGYSIPIYNLVCLFRSYKTCIENKILPWDESISYTIKDMKWHRNVLYIGAYIASFMLLFTVISAQLLPPNRGDLTVAEFVENYNYYANYFDVDFGDEYLNENGEWAKLESGGTFYLDVGYNEKPKYDFDVEDGYVKGVSFEVEIENNKDWISSYNTQMALAAYSFVCAQNEVNLFSRIPNEIAVQIDNNTFQGFNFTKAGIKITCDTEHYGYTVSHDFLFPQENVLENYYNLRFSLVK